MTGIPPRALLEEDPNVIDALLQVLADEQEQAEREARAAEMQASMARRMGY